MILLIKLPFLIPTWAAAQAGPFFVLYTKKLYLTTLAHELVHIDQWRRYLYVFFPFAYLFAWARGGFKYRNISFEKEAFTKQYDKHYIDWAKRLLDGRHSS